MKNASEVLGLIAKMQEQLASLDKKMDSILVRVLPGSSATSIVQKPQVNHHKAMFQVICADCKKECSIPFKPSGDRPVYCKDCFALRRSGNLVQVTPPVQTIKEVISTPPAKEKKKKIAVKKAVTKKKQATKKKK